MQAYSDPSRESDPHALPNVEVFDARYAHCPDCGDLLITPDCQRVACHSCQDRITAADQTGWFWWACFPGCLPDGDPIGPFDTEAAALADAQA